jgi:hypothetical protein
MARLKHRNGAVVTADDSLVDELLRRQFERVDESKPAPKKAAAKSSNK